MPILTWPSKSSPQPVQATLDLDSIIYPQGKGYSLPADPPIPDFLSPDFLTPDSLPPDLLISGDNLAAMWALLPKYEGRLNLIYADPPFFTNRHYPARIGRGEDSRKPEDWQLAEGYPDHWPDIEAYLDFLYPRLVLMHRLLAPDGALYLHLDWHANAYARLLLDEIFGAERLLNEIVWTYHGPSPIRRAFNRKHDTILAYTKSKKYTFNVDDVREPYNPSTVKTFASSPKAGFGKVPDLDRGKVPEDWWYFPVVARLHSERTGYPTQKPEALLERIILASSNPGDWVADFFCGSGTTAVVAARLGRRFIANDLTWRAVHTTRCRLVNMSSQPFAIWQVNLPSRTPKAQSSHSEQFSNLRVLSSEENTLTLTGDTGNLDYWEADPAWDGSLFRSAAQAVRPRKKQPIAHTLTLPSARGARSICVRMVNVEGQHTQVVIEDPRRIP